MGKTGRVFVLAVLMSLMASGVSIADSGLTFAGQNGDLNNVTCGEFSTMFKNKSPDTVPIVIWLHGFLSGMAIAEEGAGKGKPPGPLDAPFVKAAMIHLMKECARGTPDEKIWQAFLKIDDYRPKK